MFFEKYEIFGDDRPDNVAYEFYGDANLDWIVLISNNILNIQTEWPLTQTSFDKYLVEKYKVVGDTETDTYNRIYNGIHHYETTRATNTSGTILIQEGLRVDENYSLTYYDELISAYSTIYPVTPITNYEYEEKIEDNKRTIFLIKPKYLNVIIDDMDDFMKYKKGSGQFKTETLKTADNIKIYL
jgi:hypothetical protein